MSRASFAAGEVRQLGDYWLGRRLGEGGQGVVYEAYDGAGNRVAVKLLKTARTGNAAERRRFAKEVAATRRVAGFCTAKVIATELDGAQPYIVSEYVDGPDLRTAVEEHGAYGPAELYRLATGVATALAAIHRAGVVHRDLKPENIILSATGPKVIDFGVAWVDGATPTTDGRPPVGTPAYLSPERIYGEPAGPAADVWAWGGVVLFAATGRPPFTADNLAALYHRILTGPPDLSALDGTLRRLVRAAMAPDPADRPDAAALLRALTGGAPRCPLGTGSRIARHLARPGGRPPGPALRPLGELAEEVYARLDPADRPLVPGLLLRMVLPGDGAHRVLRWAPVDELLDDPATAAGAARVLDAFLEENLLLRKGAAVTLHSAALLRAWPRLQRWFEAERPDLYLHDRLAEAARRWRAGGHDPADLYQGAALRAAQDWAARPHGHLTANRRERLFLAASAAQERRRRRRRRHRRAAVAALTALALTAAGALVARDVTEARRRDVLAAREAVRHAERIRDTDPVRAMLLSVAAWRSAPEEAETQAALHASLARREAHVLPPGPAGGDARYDLGHDGRTLAVARDGTVRLRDVVTGREPPGTVPVRVGPGVVSLALSPDRTRVAVATAGAIRLWDLRTGRPVGRPFGMGGAEKLAFNAGGNRLTAVTPFHRGQVWDPDDPRAPLLDETSPALQDIAVDHGGDRAVLILGRGRYRFVGARGARIPPAGPAFTGTGAAAFSPDGRTLAVSLPEGIGLWDTGAGRWIDTLHGAAADAIAYSADGRHLAAYDGTAVSVWRADGTPVLHRYPARDLVGGLRFDAAGGALAYRRAGGEVALLDLADLLHPPALLPEVHDGAVAERADAVALQGETATLLVAGGAVTALPDGGAGPGTVLALSPDGRRLAMAVPDESVVRIWDLPAVRPARELVVAGAVRVGGLAFAHDGATLAVAPIGDAWQRVQLWDARRGVRLGTLDLTGGRRMAFSPDDRLLAVNGPEDSAIADLAAPAPRVRRKVFGTAGHEGRAVAFSPDGTVLAGRAGAGIDLLDTASLRPVGRLEVPEGDADQIDHLAFSPDGRLLAAGGYTGRVWLWHLADGLPLGGPIPRHAGRILGLAFSPDGSVLRTVGADGVRHEHPVALGRAAAAVCARVRATLTEAGRSASLRPAEHRSTC